MKSITLKTAAALLLTVSSGTLFGQAVTQPGQIAAEPAAILSPGLAPAVSPLPIQTAMPQMEDRHDKIVNRVWIASILTMAAATGMDAASSWGKQEGNSLLASSNGTFGAKGLSIKSGVGLAVIVPQLLLRRHKDLKSKFAIGNFAEAAFFGGIAIHNMGIPAAR